MNAVKKLKTPRKLAKMSTVPAGEFKARCLELMNEVRDRHTEIVITKRGMPVAKLVPYEGKKQGDIFGYAKGSIVIHGDIIEPTGEVWEADG